MRSELCKDCGPDPQCDCEIGCPYKPADSSIMVEFVEAGAAEVTHSKDDISWTLRCRNGVVKRFKFSCK